MLTRFRAAGRVHPRPAHRWPWPSWGFRPQVERLEDRFAPASTWLGTTSSDWQEKSNWSTNTVPGKDDDVIIAKAPNVCDGGGELAKTIEVQNGGFLDVGASLVVVGNVTVDAGGTVRVSSVGDLMVGGASFTNNGSLTFTGGGAEGNLTNAGTLSVPTGNAGIVGNVTSSGNIYVSNQQGAAAGSLGIEGDFTLTGQLQVKVTGHSTISSLNVTGNVNLGGTLRETHHGLFSAVRWK